MRNEGPHRSVFDPRNELLSDRDPPAFLSYKAAAGCAQSKGLRPPGDIAVCILTQSLTNVATQAWYADSFSTALGIVLQKQLQKEPRRLR